MSVDELEMRGEEEMKGEISEDILGLSVTEALLYLFKKIDSFTLLLVYGCFASWIHWNQGSGCSL